LLGALFEIRDREANLKLIGCDGVAVNCHKQVLCSASAYFESMFDFERESNEESLEYEGVVL
jgi:hypothetical protein